MKVYFIVRKLFEDLTKNLTDVIDSIKKANSLIKKVEEQTFFQKGFFLLFRVFQIVVEKQTISVSFLNTVFAVFLVAIWLACASPVKMINHCF